MMHDIFLNEAAPLYKRARRVLNVKPMTYNHFCEYLSLKLDDRENYVKYSMVCGAPKYWQYIDPKLGVLDLAQERFYGELSFFENEADTILSDESIVDDPSMTRPALEFDMVRVDLQSTTKKSLIVSEVKWQPPKSWERIKYEIEAKFSQSKLSTQHYVLSRVEGLSFEDYLALLTVSRASSDHSRK